MTVLAKTLSLIVSLLIAVPAGGLEEKSPAPIRVVSRDVFIKKGTRPVCTGFITYIHKTKPMLMHCYGFQDYSDGYDDYGYQISRDNGKTWSARVVGWKSEVVPEGRVRYGEHAAFFDRDSSRLIVLTNKTLYPEDRFDNKQVTEVVIDTYDPASDRWSERRPLDLSPGRSIAVSFSFPLKIAGGRLLFPAMRPTIDANNRHVHYPGCWAPLDEALQIIGDFRPDGSISWQLGEPIRISPETSSRGLDENAIAELRDGRVAAVCRGDNSMFPEKPGYKWLSFSSDRGKTWTSPVPFPCTEGLPIESGANGSAFFRSIKDGRLYWIGNLCVRGRRPKGNFPRTPLVVARVEEEPFGIIRDSISVVDEQGPGEPDNVQMSNFRFYQDRETFDLVIFYTRYSERSAENWMDADYHRLRVRLN
ncbi:MAG: hypothetical protein A2W03_16275 [Candidatus Aminicenantes bacterium RBG_16_63_16]|nr:MAG: hypothetical protein A2W03_16275 [Candidatus Aminicenantes bacterium RBG_16_63_16]